MTCIVALFTMCWFLTPMEGWGKKKDNIFYDYVSHIVKILWYTRNATMHHNPDPRMLAVCFCIRILQSFSWHFQRTFLRLRQLCWGFSYVWTVFICLCRHCHQAAYTSNVICIHVAVVTRKLQLLKLYAFTSASQYLDEDFHINHWFVHSFCCCCYCCWRCNTQMAFLVCCKWLSKCFCFRIIVNYIHRIRLPSVYAMLRCSFRFFCSFCSVQIALKSNNEMNAWSIYALNIK